MQTDLVKKGFEVRAYTKENPDSPYNVPKNVGQDATAYLKYIIDNYEDLPEYSIMTHDHEYSHHQEGNIVDDIIEQSPLLGLHPSNKSDQLKIYKLYND